MISILRTTSKMRSNLHFYTHAWMSPPLRLYLHPSSSLPPHRGRLFLAFSFPRPSLGRYIRVSPSTFASFNTISAALMPNLFSGPIFWSSCISLRPTFPNISQCQIATLFSLQRYGSCMRCPPTPRFRLVPTTCPLVALMVNAARWHRAALRL